MKTPSPRGYAEFITLFNKKKFFEAHEALEAEWHRQNRRNDFYKGLIQLAAVFVHIQKSNIAGARILMGTSKKYLAPCFPRYQGIPIKELFEAAEVIIETFGSQEKIPHDLQYPAIELED